MSVPLTGDWQSIRCLALSFTAVLALTIGCGRGVTLVPVSGRVEVDGKPLSTGRVMVVPEKGRPATAKISRDGTFSLSTFVPNDGVMPGRHRVEIVAFEQLNADERRWLVPRRVGNIATSDVVLDVTAATSDAVISIATGGEKLDVERTGGD